MPKKNHQNEALASAKMRSSGLLSGSSQQVCPIAPSAASLRNEVSSSTALPHLAEVSAGTKLRSRGSLRRAREVEHELDFDGLHDRQQHPSQAPKPDAFEFIPAPKLRAKLGISAVTLWRWRHDKENGFPAPKVINGRLYFPLGAVAAWLARQGDTA